MKMLMRIKKKMLSLKEFIYNLSRIDESIGLICTNGACYKLALFLKQLYPECELYISPDKDHVVVRYLGKFYDINGERSCFNYSPLTTKEELDCANWSFSKLYHAGHICQECGELIEEDYGGV